MHIEEKTAEAINTLGCFCGKRDVEELTPAALKRAFGIEQADVMVLFGGSILAGGDVLACAMEKKIARRYVIVGGRGHTTETLCRQMEREISGLRTDGLSEAELFQAYLKEKYGREADWLETESTNCGNNITYLLELLKAKKFAWKSIILFGSPANYVSRGFKSCKKYNLCVEGGGYPAGMLAKELKEGAFDGRKWTYSGSPVMDVDGQEAARFDDALPPMEKEYRPSQDEFYIISQAFLG